jgi:hypothetical protein
MNPRRDTLRLGLPGTFESLESFFALTRHTPFGRSLEGSWLRICRKRKRCDYFTEYTRFFPRQAEVRGGGGATHAEPANGPHTV